MNKNIINSIQKNLYSKVAFKLDEMRREISASLFENTEYRGDPSVQRLAQIRPEEERDYGQELIDDCNEYVKKHHPEASGDEYTKLMKKCMGHIEESKDIPEPVIARRIAGGMDPKKAKTKKLGFKGKHPGKG